MTGREELVAQVADAIAEHLGDDLPHTSTAQAVLDAILPQVSTVEDLANASRPALLIRETDGYAMPTTLVLGHDGRMYYNGVPCLDPQTVLNAGPLTVVWQP